MKISALITTLVLGSSSLAMAQSGRAWRGEHARFSDQTPGSRYEGPVRDRPVLRDDDDATWYGGARTYRATWVSLTEPTQLQRGRELIPVSPRAGTFTQLRLQATSGETFVAAVKVRFTDGTTQVKELRRTIDAGSPLAELELDRNQRRIAQITVYGDSSDDGAYQIFGI